MIETSYILQITPAEIRKFTKRLKSSWDFANLLCIVGQYYILHKADIIRNPVRTYGYIKISFDNIGGRCFIYISSNKYLSFVFPFRFNGRVLRYKGTVIDEIFISYLITISESGQSGSSLIEQYIDNGNNCSRIPDQCFKVIEELLLLDSGYLRHDDDPSSARGVIHPRFHFDVFFSKEATFKVGLSKMLTSKKYEDFFKKDKSKFFLHNNPKQLISDIRGGLRNLGRKSKYKFKIIR